MLFLTLSLYSGVSEVYDQVYEEIIAPNMGIEYNQYGGMDYEGSKKVVEELTVPVNEGKA